MRTQTTKIVTGKVNGTTGEISAVTGGAATSRRTATGVYPMTFPGLRLQSLHCTPNTGAAAYLINATTYTENGATVYTITAAAGAIDLAFTFTATGVPIT